MTTHTQTNRWLQIVGKDKLQTFQDLFAQSFGLSVCFLDLEGMPLTVWSKDSLICHAIWRNNEVRCVECGTLARTQASSGKAYTYVCPFGLTCAVLPIIFCKNLCAYIYISGAVYEESKLPPPLREKYHLAVYSKEKFSFIVNFCLSILQLLDLEVSGGAFLSEGGKKATRLRDERISVREQEIVDLICQGKSNRQIADSLFISETTVKTHVSNILTKLDLRDRKQIIVYYYAREKEQLR